MNLETRAIPPPIPEDAKRKGPPPIPEDAIRSPKPEKGPLATVNQPTFKMIESREATTTLKVGMASEASFDHPDRNEDSFYASPELGILLVSDGMGGVPAGDVASRIVAEQLTAQSIQEACSEATQPEDLRKAELIKQVFLSNREAVQNRNAVQEAMQEMLLRMNKKVEAFTKTDPVVRERALQEYETNFGHYNESDARSSEVLKSIIESIGSTVSLVKLWRGPDGKDRITLGQVGDSRVYRLRKGKLEQLTKDDSHVQVLIEEGIKDKDGVPILDDQDVDRLIPKDEIFRLADKRTELRPLMMKLLRTPDPFLRLGDIRAMVTQAIGLGSFMKKQFGTELKPRVTTESVEDNDFFLLTTDGITDVLLDTEIQEILTRHADNPQAAAEELERQASIRTIRGKPKAKEALSAEEKKKRERAKTDDRTVYGFTYKKTAK